MMICPETFYEMNLKGKTAEQIMTTIRGLKQEIGRLRNIIEHPEYECTVHPSEQVRIACYRSYLDRAIQAFEETGSTYIPSAAEKKATEFDANIPYITNVFFSIGGFFNGYKTRKYTIDGDKIRGQISQSIFYNLTNIDDAEILEMEIDDFFSALKDLHIGQWRKHYNTHRFGYLVCDGFQWHFEIYFSNGYKPVKISGDNAYPYNFDQLLELFKVEI